MKDAKFDLNICYSKEVLISECKIGQAFASCDEVWVKISVDSCVVIGKEKIVKYTSKCAAFPIKSMDVYL